MKQLLIERPYIKELARLSGTENKIQSTENKHFYYIGKVITRDNGDVMGIIVFNLTLRRAMIVRKSVLHKLIIRY